MIYYSSFENNFLWLPVIGFVIGLFGSMIGGGGGFIFIPLLTLLFNVPAQVAVPTSLAATLPICIVGSVGHYQAGNINMRIGMLFVSAGILGAFIGAGFTSIMTTSQLKIGFGIYAILIALQMIYNNIKKSRSEAKGLEQPDKSRTYKFSRSIIFGFLAGIISGTFGTSGTAPVLAGLFALQLPLKIVIGTSLVIISMNTVFALGAHFLLGKIDLTLVYFLSAGAILGAFAGPKIISSIKIDRAENSIRYWYALGMIIFGILMITVK